jgi:uncharacterized repeat protein (TIGR03837 family)
MHERWISLFCYEPHAIGDLLQALSIGDAPTRLMVTAGRASAAIRSLMGLATVSGSLRINYLPLMSQVEYDSLLWACDINFVRGEDSLVRAIWAAKPFVWQIYPQADNAHIDKLNAFLGCMEADTTMRALHNAWNDVDNPPLPNKAQSGWEMINQRKLVESWSDTALAARRRLLGMDDLTTQLLQFVSKKR